MTVVEAGPDEEGLRFDKALAFLGGLSRSMARAMIELGEATLNGEVVAPRTAVHEGDSISFTPPKADEALVPDATVPFEVIAERPDYVVIAKPPGLVVHPGTGVRMGTLVHGLLARYPEISGVGQPGRWGIVHRLDRDTSGLMLVARTPDGYEALTGMIRAREVQRTYLALVVGSFGMATGTIDAPIRRDPDAPMRMAISNDGRFARTHYRLREAMGAVTLMEVELETGRTHQIRVHFASIGHPVVGDPVYGRRDPVAVPRIFLHALRLGFVDPFTGTDVTLEAELPSDLDDVLTDLRTS